MSNISQDPREAPNLLDDGNKLVYVQYESGQFQWGTDTGSLVPLSTTIEIESDTRINFEFIRIGSTSLWYKLPPTAPAGTVLPTSNGPTTLVEPGSRSSIAFATSSGGTYFTGYVKVSDDGLDDLSGGGGGDSSDAGDSPTE